MVKKVSKAPWKRGFFNGMNPDLNAITNTTNQQKIDTTNFLNDQNNQIGQFNNGFSSFINGLPSTSALAGKIGDELNLPTLRANANTLNTTFANLPSTYKNAEAGFDVNNNQLSRVIGQKAYELSPAMTTANNALNTAETQLGTRLGYAKDDINRSLLPWQSQQQLLSDKLARESSMFSQENQNELNGLIARINAGVTLTNAEKDRANQLAIAEKGYQSALAVAQQNTKYLPVMGMGAINTQTGGFITPTSGGWS